MYAYLGECVWCRLLSRTTEITRQNKHVSTHLIGPLTICEVKIRLVCHGFSYYNFTVTLSQTGSPVEGDVYNFYDGKILSPVPV